jgi:tRNA/rRNA methyltransferase
MGLSRLILVNQPLDSLKEASKLATGAQAILDQAEFCTTLADAVAGHGLVIGTSRHAGKQRKNIRTPREAAALVLPLLAKNRVAVLFGNEVNGLDNHDIALCHELIAIPSSDAFPSLNLSHAVMVVAYELFTAMGGGLPPSGVELARTEEFEDLYCHLQKTLQETGFLDRDHPERIMFSLRQIGGRARMDSRDVAILRGILSNFERAIRACSKDS